ncbi:MBL fold metallo-hydrolase [Kangiella sp.]|uniref:MBL fold metallo-hydrolase n=1 Tax=Kangiella sp. TaxID=1920245 RepID=UPI003A8FF01E
MKTLSAIILLTLSSMVAAEPSEIQVNKLASEVYLLKASNYSTNIGVIKKGRDILLIDPMPGSGNIPELYRKIEENFSPETIVIINTHAHEDHSGGNSFFSDNGAVVLNSNENIVSVKSIPVRSHSTSDNIFWHKASNIMFVGDIYDTSWHPTFYAGGISGFTEAMSSVLALADDDTVIVPGHGQPTGVEALQTYKQSTIEWVARVKELNKQGLTVLEIRADKTIESLLRYFAQKNEKSALPEKAVIRFIERTLTVIEKYSV